MHRVRTISVCGEPTSWSYSWVCRARKARSPCGLDSDNCFETWVCSCMTPFYSVLAECHLRPEGRQGECRAIPATACQYSGMSSMLHFYAVHARTAWVRCRRYFRVYQRRASGDPAGPRHPLIPGGCRALTCTLLRKADWAAKAITAVPDVSFKQQRTR